MECVCCGSAAVTERPERTARGYRRFRCRDCGRQFNERSAGSLNRTQYPSDVVALVVLWRLRYRLTLRDLSEMFLLRGIVFSHEAVREWEAKLAPLLAGELRRRRRGRGGARGHHWHVDETYLKVRGRWAYLYRAIDRGGNLVDTMLSEHRDMAAAQAFFRSEPVNLSAGTRLIPFSSPVGYRAGRHVRRGERDARGIELWPVREPAGAGADGAARGGATAAQGRAAAGQPAAGQSGGSAAGGSPGALRLGVRRAAGPVGAVWRDQGGRGPSWSSAGRPARPAGALALRHGGGRGQRARTGPAVPRAHRLRMAVRRGRHEPHDPGRLPRRAWRRAGASAGRQCRGDAEVRPRLARPGGAGRHAGAGGGRRRLVPPPGLARALPRRGGGRSRPAAGGTRGRSWRPEPTAGRGPPARGGGPRASPPSRRPSRGSRPRMPRRG